MKTTGVVKKLWVEATPPDGLYSGSRSGYVSSFTASDGIVYKAETHNGVRGINVPCNVLVVDGVASIT